MIKKHITLAFLSRALPFSPFALFVERAARGALLYAGVIQLLSITEKKKALPDL